MLCATAVVALAASPGLFRQSSALFSSIKTAAPSGIYQYGNKSTPPPGILYGEATGLKNERRLRSPAVIADVEILFVLDPNFYL